MGSLWCWDHREACPEGSAQIRSRRQTSSLTIPEDGSRATRKARPKPNHFLAEARKRGRTGTKTAKTKEKIRRNDFSVEEEERRRRNVAPQGESRDPSLIKEAPFGGSRSTPRAMVAETGHRRPRVVGGGRSAEYAARHARGSFCPGFGRCPVRAGAP